MALIHEREAQVAERAEIPDVDISPPVVSIPEAAGDQWQAIVKSMNTVFHSLYGRNMHELSQALAERDWVQRLEEGFRAEAKFHPGQTEEQTMQLFYTALEHEGLKAHNGNGPDGREYKPDVRNTEGSGWIRYYLNLETEFQNRNLKVEPNGLIQFAIKLDDQVQSGGMEA
jgi:hypothetical protein